MSDKAAGDPPSSADHNRVSQKGGSSASPRPKRNFLEGVKNTLRPKKSHDMRTKVSAASGREPDFVEEEAASPSGGATDHYATKKPDMDSQKSVDSTPGPSC